MIVQLLEPGTHFAEEIDHGEIEFEIRSNPHPVTVRILSKANHDLFEKDEEYLYLGPDDASRDHEFQEYLDPNEGPWFLVVLNEHKTAATAVGTESYLDDSDDDEEEEDDEDDVGEGDKGDDDEDDEDDEDEDDEDDGDEEDGDEDGTPPPSGNA